jgi:hypothetical protein
MMKVTVPAGNKGGDPITVQSSSGPMLVVVPRGLVFFFTLFLFASSS